LKAAVLEAPRRLRTVRMPDPEPAAGQVRVRVQGCGVCGSDLANWEGRDWFRYPMEPGRPGHEAWGVVDAVGDGVDRLRPGQRVTGLFDGAYADLLVADARNVLPVPSAVGDQPLPAEAIACAVNAAGRAGITKGDEVAVVGVGFQGAMLVQLARAAGAHVTAVSRRACACTLAERLGAQRSVTASAGWQAGEVLQGSDGFDVVLEATGRQESLDLATNLVRTRGRLVIAGYHQDPRMVNVQQWNWKGIDVVNAHERAPERYLAGMQEGMRRLALGQLRVAPLVTHRFPLDEAAAAFEAMERREDGFLKGVVCP